MYVPSISPAPLTVFLSSPLLSYSKRGALGALPFLKSDTRVHTDGGEQERRKIIEASAEEKIAMMEERRKRLVMQRRPFQRKLEEVQARMKTRDEEAAAKADNK